MKFLKTFLILSLCFIFCEETKEANQKELKGWNFEINGSLGQISPITSSDRAKNLTLVLLWASACMRLNH